MGSTHRNHGLEISLPTRSTDVSMMDQCAGRWVLTQLRHDEQREAVFFELGTILHNGIEHAITYDTDFEQTMDGVDMQIDQFIERVKGQRVLQSSRRNIDTMHEDARRMMNNWFKQVHPDSKHRLPFYTEFDWPPRVEVTFERAGGRFPAWGKVDTIFTYKNAHHTIIDWKSGSERPPSDFQLNFYRYGLGYGNVPAYYHMLDRVRKPSILVPAGDYPGDAAMNALVMDTEEVKLDMLDGTLPTFRPDWYCNYCPVQHLCPVEGDVRNRDKNLTELRRLLVSARPLTTVLDSLPGDPEQ